MDNNSHEYEAARAASSAAFRIYEMAVALYRSRAIGDAEFLAARAQLKLAEEAFDAAYAAEEKRVRRNGR